MLLIALNDDAVTGTDTINCMSGIVGGVVINSDGTNAAVVTLQRASDAGKVVFSYSGLEAQTFYAPISLEGSTVLYYSVTGTGASAQFFEGVP